MFIEKIERLAGDWGKSISDMEEIIKSSLRYGMRLDRHPGRLKRELKKLKIDSTLATPLWSGNAYLLITLPQVLINKKKKIPSLLDFQYARKNLNEEDIQELEVKIANIPVVTPHEILMGMMPVIRRKAYSKGRFLPAFDRMHGSMEDIQQDLFIEAAAIVNKQYMNLNSHKKEDIDKYMGVCFKSKSDTYLKSTAPKVKRVRVEESKIFEKLIHNKAQEDGEDWENNPELNSKEVMHDLQRILSKKAYLGVSLLMKCAPTPEQSSFDRFLETHGMKDQKLSAMQTKKYIEKYLNSSDLFNQLKKSKSFLTYLRE